MNLADDFVPVGYLMWWQQLEPLVFYLLLAAIVFAILLIIILIIVCCCCCHKYKDGKNKSELIVLDRMGGYFLT